MNSSRKLYFNAVGLLIQEKDRWRMFENRLLTSEGGSDKRLDIIP
jgi:hypothetical protein